MPLCSQAKTIPVKKASSILCVRAKSKVLPFRIRLLVPKLRKPPRVVVKSACPGELPAGWEQHFSHQYNIPFYWNSVTHESRWCKPIVSAPDESNTSAAKRARVSTSNTSDDPLMVLASSSEDEPQSPPRTSTASAVEVPTRPTYLDERLLVRREWLAMYKEDVVSACNGKLLVESALLHAASEGLQKAWKELDQCRVGLAEKEAKLNQELEDITRRKDALGKVLEGCREAFPELGIASSATLGETSSANLAPNQLPEVSIIGFVYDSYEHGGNLCIDEDDWDGLRNAIHRAIGVKDEFDEHADRNDSDAETQVAHVQTIPNFWEHVWALQANIKGEFRDGRKLESLIAACEENPNLPMEDDNLIISGALANVRLWNHRERRHEVVKRFFTFDHRRLWCFYQAHCRRLRFKVKVTGRYIDEMYSKADGLGRPVWELIVRTH